MYCFVQKSNHFQEFEQLFSDQDNKLTLYTLFVYDRGQIQISQDSNCFISNFYDPHFCLKHRLSMMLMSFLITRSGVLRHSSRSAASSFLTLLTSRCPWTRRSRILPPENSTLKRDSSVIRMRFHFCLVHRSCFLAFCAHTCRWRDVREIPTCGRSPLSPAACRRYRTVL